MEGDARRTEIVKIMQASKSPISGSALAKKMEVSRQIIVGDIALLRAQGIDIVATNSGYILGGNVKGVKSVKVSCKHKLEDTFDEICTIIDEGARVVNEGIVHDVYGEISVSLNISNRSEAKRYTESLMLSNSEDLMILTGNNHFHVVEADNDLILLRVQKALRDKGYLAK